MVLPDILVTTIYTVLTLALAEFLRLAFRAYFKEGSPVLHQCVQEFIAAFELCAVCFEIGILLTEYGVFMYSIYLTAVSVWWSLRWAEATAAPYTHVEDWFSGAEELLPALIIIFSELAGGMIFYRLYLAPLWSISRAGLAHEAKLTDEFCFSDIQVPVFYAALIEGSGIFILQLVVKILSDSSLSGYVGAVLESVLSTAFVAAALSTTGGYFNPVLATASQYGCIGSSILDHFLVYWVAETVGALLAYVLWTQTNLFGGLKLKDD